MPHSPITVETEPGLASADKGVVMLDGPGGVAVSMSPDAAEGTADSLHVAADIARTQQPPSDA